MDDALEAILKTEDDCALAVIVGTEGPAYRPLGTMMAVLTESRRVGTLSSGCIESDVALQALDALNKRTPRAIRYGRGSPFFDIQLPCGGGLDILIIPRPDKTALEEVARVRRDRIPRTLRIDMATGAMEVLDQGETGREGGFFRIRFTPDLRFLVFGKGPEASGFAALTQSVGYPTLLLSPDNDTLEAGRKAGCPTRHLTHAHFPDDLDVDQWSSVVLFFHDHDWEPEILSKAAKTDAFYIGAQGSRRSRDLRMMELQSMGLSDAELKRLRGPIGLIPSVRDPRTLSVSVLSEILATAMPRAA
jgi:xanthine dehydrogenase accessory factor